MIPAELQGPPPRDPGAAGALFDRNKSLIRGLIVGTIFLPPAMLACFWLKFGTIDALAIGLTAGVDSLVALFGVAMTVQLARAKRLYRDGIAAVGRVKKVDASPDPQGNAYIFVHVEFVDAAGATRTGKVTTIGRANETGRRAGDEVAVLYLADEPRKFAIYTPGLGMAPGVVTA